MMWQSVNIVLSVIFSFQLCLADVTTMSNKNVEGSKHIFTDIDEKMKGEAAKRGTGVAVNQVKDISGFRPVISNVTHIRDVSGINQVRDVNDIVPVVVNQTKVKEEFTTEDMNKTVNVPVHPPLTVIEDNIQPISDIPSVDVRIKSYSIGTEYCRQKNRCNSTIPSKTCFCDRVCGVLEDCCEDAHPVNDANLHLSQFSCNYISGVSNHGENILMVTKCAPYRNASDVTEKLCDQTLESDDIFSQIPVSDLTPSAFVYKNRYCALCNNVYKYKYWKATVRCLEDTGVINITDKKNCALSYQMPDKSSTFRKCEIYSDVISQCAASYTAEEVREKCNNSSYSIVHTYAGEQYRNKYCAICNDVDERDLYCEEQFRMKTQSIVPPKLYTFRMIVDFNSKWIVKNEQMKTHFNDCKDIEIYDPFTKACREIFCPNLTLPSQGQCVQVPRENNNNFTSTISNVETNLSNISLLSIENCVLLKINHSEFEFLNDSNNIVIRKLIFNETDYLKNGSDVFVCLEKLNINSEQSVNKSSVRTLYHFNEIESYISMTGIIVSIIASVLTLFVYILFPQLLNVPGKNLICLIISLIVSQTLFLLAAVVAEMQTICTVFAVLMHYSFLCAFCWMNIIAFDLWFTFSYKFGSQHHQATRSKRFYIYSLYGWCLPLFIVGFAVILNFARFSGQGVTAYRPNYGHVVCWITNKTALIIFFVGPLALFKLFDFILFGFTAYNICKIKQQSAFARRGSSFSTFLINIRLSFVMGLTWIFAFVANFTNNSIMWYLFIIFNTLQGLFIALSFLCTRRVMKLFREKYYSFISQMTETQLTVLSGTKSTE